MIISCFHIIGLNVTCFDFPPQRPLQRIQVFMGIQYLIIKLCTPLIPLLLGIQNILYPLKDQRGDTEFDGDTQFHVTPVVVNKTSFGIHAH